MWCPPGHSDEELCAIIDRISDVIAAKYSLPGFDQADMKQEVWLEALAVLDKFSTGQVAFDPTRGSLASLIYVSLCRRFLNKIRDNVYRNDTPCKKCLKAAEGCGEFCQDTAEPCEAYKRWRERNESKRNIARGISLQLVDDEHESNTRLESQVEAQAEVKELMQLVDERLPIELRATWLQLRAGVSVPTVKRQQVEEALLDILDDAGVPLPPQLNPEAPHDCPLQSSE